MNKSKGKSSKFVKIAVMAIIVAVIAYFAKQTYDIIKLNQEKKSLEEKKITLEKLKENLEIELDNASTDSYIENLARRDLKLIKVGEKLFVFSGGYYDDNTGKTDN